MIPRAEPKTYLSPIQVTSVEEGVVHGLFAEAGSDTGLNPRASVMQLPAFAGRGPDSSPAQAGACTSKARGFSPVGLICLSDQPRKRRRVPAIAGVVVGDAFDLPAAGARVGAAQSLVESAGGVVDVDPDQQGPVAFL